MHIHTQTKTLTVFMVNCLLGFSVRDEPLLLCHVFGAFCTFGTVRDRNKLRFLTSSTCNLVAHWQQFPAATTVVSFLGFDVFCLFLWSFSSLCSDWMFYFSFSLVSSTDVTSPSKAQPLPLMQFPTGKFSVLCFLVFFCHLFSSVCDWSEN